MRCGRRNFAQKEPGATELNLQPIDPPALPQNEAETMLGRSAATAARVAARSQPKGQKRTFIDYLTNYPDRVSTIVSVSPERRPLVSRYRWCLRTGFYAELRTRPTDLIG